MLHLFHSKSTPTWTPSSVPSRPNTTFGQWTDDESRSPLSLPIQEFDSEPNLSLARTPSKIVTPLTLSPSASIEIDKGEEFNRNRETESESRFGSPLQKSQSIFERLEGSFSSSMALLKNVKKPGPDTLILP